MRELKIGESYTGDELAEIVDEVSGTERWRVVIGERVYVIVSDDGNDNWCVEEVIDR